MKKWLTFSLFVVIVLILSSCSKGFDKQAEQNKAKKKLIQFSHVYSKKDDEQNKVLFTSKNNDLDKKVNEKIFKTKNKYFSKNYKKNVLSEIKAYKNKHYDEFQETSSNTFYLEVLPYGALEDKEYKVLPNNFGIEKGKKIKFNKEHKTFTFPVEIRDESANQQSNYVNVKMIREHKQWVIDEVTFQNNTQSENNKQT